MRIALKFVGWTLLAILGLIGVLIAMNWTIAKNVYLTRDAKIMDVDRFAPRRIVAGCDMGPLEAHAQSPIQAAVIDEMQAYSLSHGGVGLIVLVDGKIAGEAYRDGADQTTRTRSFSMHKSVLGLAYGHALADGIIESMDDPIGTYLTEWADDPRGAIPVGAFLTMASGMRSPSFLDDQWEATKFLLSSKVTETALSMDQRSEPWSQFWYKNVDSQLAGAALNRALKAAGKTGYAAYLSEKIWCPIGAQDALLWPEDETGDPRFYANLDATVRDWVRVGQMIAENGAFMGNQVMPDGWIETYKTPSKTNPNYGIQVWLSSPYVKERAYNPGSPVKVLQSAPHLADDIIFFDGFGGQRVYVSPSNKLVIARSGEVSNTWDDAVLVNLALEALQAAPQASAR